MIEFSYPTGPTEALHVSGEELVKLTDPIRSSAACTLQAAAESPRPAMELVMPEQQACTSCPSTKRTKPMPVLRVSWRTTPGCPLALCLISATPLRRCR